MNKKKKILFICPTSLYPKIMASQDRMTNMALYLSRHHHVDIILPDVKDKKLKEGTLNVLKQISGDIFFVKHKNKTNLLNKTLHHIVKFLSKVFTNDPSEAFFARQNFVLKQIVDLIKLNKYDIIHLEYWYQGKILNQIENSLIKVIDTHNVLYQKRELEKEVLGNKFEMTYKQIKKYKKLELESYKSADVLISISEQDLMFFKQKFPEKQHVLIYTGQNLQPYLKIKSTVHKDNFILFYGSMGGIQNVNAFWRLYTDIFPFIKKEVPDAKLLVVGSNPPEEISLLQNNKDVVVTGFVDDLVGVLSKASVMILPMEIAGGFRSRVVEVMALGIPVIGTHNALDSTSISNGVEGYIEDDNRKMAKLAVSLLQNPEKRMEMGEKARIFCVNNFSYENTYGKLSELYSKL